MFAESTSTLGLRVVARSLHFALPTSIAQQTVSEDNFDSFSDIASDALDLEVQYHSATKQSASTSSTRSREF